MRKFESKEIIKLLDHLIGNTEAVGETNADEKALENLKVLIDITNWCLDGVHQTSESCGRPEWSMNKVGFEAKCALDEYRVWLNELWDEVSEDVDM